MTNFTKQFAPIGELKRITGRSEKFWAYSRQGRVNNRGIPIPPQLTEGIEFIRVNSHSILYNVPLCLSFLQWGAGSPEHCNNIEAYLASVQAAPPKKTRKTKSAA